MWLTQVCSAPFASRSLFHGWHNISIRLLWRQGDCAVCNDDNIAMFRECGSPSDQWWGNGPRPNLVNTSCYQHHLSVGSCFDKRHTTLWTESQPYRSVSGVITIIVQEVGITNSLARLISDCSGSLGINCLQWLIIISAKDMTLSLSYTPEYLAKVHRAESCNEADNLMSVHKHRGVSNCPAIIPWY